MASPIRIKVEVDTKLFDGQMKGFVKQVPFALSRSLNKTAQKTVPDLRASAKKDMTIRGPWVTKGVQMRASTKTNLVAEVGSVDPYMVKQVEGGTKTAQGGNLAIPLKGAGRARPRKKSITPPETWPKNLAASDPDVFVGFAGYKQKLGKINKRRGKRYNKIKTFNDSESGTFAVWRRKPKHKLKMVYAFKKQVEVEGRWDIEKIVAASVKEYWPEEVRKAIEYAKATAKR